MKVAASDIRETVNGRFGEKVVKKLDRAMLKRLQSRTRSRSHNPLVNINAALMIEVTRLKRLKRNEIIQWHVTH